MADSAYRIAALGLGGNIGDPRDYMARALRMLDSHEDCRLVTVSALYRTPPWGKTDQNDFLNCCALLETRLEPEALLDLCLDTEARLERVRAERWGPRTIDIDVLALDGQRVSTDRIEIPHPRMTQRAFVLVPLADIAPDMEIDGRTVSGWLEGLDSTGVTVADDTDSWWQE